jgi:uncharacterized membrane protein YdjX (TVP38/TMEM64 family)
MGSLAPFAFFGVYFVGTYVFAPTCLLNLASGALLGVPAGFATAMAASLASASVSFLAGRHLSRKWILQKFLADGKFHALDAAVDERGWKLVLLLRLGGIVPFTLLNYSLGLSKISFTRYFVASAAGMTPGTLLYVYLGSVAGRFAIREGGGPKGPLEWALMATGFAATLALGFYAAAIVKKALKAPSRI